MKHFILICLLFAAAPLRADELERTVALMAKVNSASNPSFSPDGKRLAFTSNMSGLPQIWTVASDGGWPDLVTALDDPVNGIEWSPDGKWIAFQLAPGGGLNEQIYVVRPDGTGMRRLTAGGKENNWLGTWSHDSKSIAISSNQRSGDAMDSHLIDVASGSMRLVAKNPGIGTLESVSRDNRFGLVWRMVNRGDTDIYRVALDGRGEEIRLTTHEPPATFDGAFGADAGTVYLASNAGRDLTVFGKVKVDRKGQAGPLEVVASRTDGELDSFRINDQGTVAVLVWNLSGRNEISFADLTTGKLRAGPALPADIVFGVTFSDDGSRLALVLSGSSRPADIWVMDMGTAKLTQVTRSPHAGIARSDLIRPELVKFDAHDGVPLSGWLYRPRNAKPPYPTVFSFHGGPEGQERPSFNSTYQALLSQGMAVFAPNVRGSSGFGKRFVNLDNGALRVNGVRDMKTSVDHLVSKGITDQKRAGVMGGSYGGYMVMAGLTEFPDLFAAGANLFGVVNFETFFKHSEPWMGAISKIEYGNPETEVAMLRSLSPIHKVERIKAPLLVLHGANDTNVPVIEAEQTVDSLKKRNVPVEYVLFADEGHGWRKTPNRIRSTVTIVRFFARHLK